MNFSLSILRTSHSLAHLPRPSQETHLRRKLCLLVVGDTFEKDVLLPISVWGCPILTLWTLSRKRNKFKTMDDDYDYDYDDDG